VIVEIDPGQVSILVTQVLHTLTSRASQPATPRPEAEEQPAEEASSIDRMNDPPPDLVQGQAPAPPNG
jgi:hypothetical protein